MKVKEALEGPEKKLTQRDIAGVTISRQSAFVSQYRFDITVLCLGKISAEPGQYRRI